MSPVLENSLVDGLCLVQVLTPIRWNSCPQNVVMAALDDVDGVDLYIAKMLDRRRRGYGAVPERSEEHTSELQSLMRISYAVFCLNKKLTYENNVIRTEDYFID